ncbi:MAG: universal stress protein, partial [Acidobacteriota bacterium]|nr:universal stress protein [Acidobacteriota bacterium]
DEAIALAARLGARLLIVSAREPVDIAEEQGCDLIMVGNKGTTGAKRFLLGSVPNKVSQHAPCSVLIVRTT